MIFWNIERISPKKETTMYDIIIIGAGPSGSNLARLLGDKYKILLVDKRDLSNDNNSSILGKSCGGLLAPDAQEMLAKLGLGIPKEILVSPQLFAVRTIDNQNKIERLYQRFYINIDREKFDRWLVSLIPCNVDKNFGCLFKGLEILENKVKVTLSHNGSNIVEESRLVVGADGANSFVGKQIHNVLNPPSKYISIQQQFHDNCHQPYFTAIFDDEITDFYSWIIPKDGKILVGSALKIDDTPKEKFELFKDKLEDMGFNLENSSNTSGAFINRPRNISQINIGNNKVVLMGEASGAISPSSAEGISYALKSSYYLYDSLSLEMNGFYDRYKSKMKSIETNIALKNMKIPAMYNPTLRNIIMKTGIKSINSSKELYPISPRI